MKDAQRTVPRGIISVLAAVRGLYVLVAAAVVLADRAGRRTVAGPVPGEETSDCSPASAASWLAGTASRRHRSCCCATVRRHGIERAIAGGIGPCSSSHAHAGRGDGNRWFSIVLVVALIVPLSICVFDNAVTLIVFALVDPALWRGTAPRNQRSRPHFTVAAGCRERSGTPAVALLLAEALI